MQHIETLYFETLISRHVLNETNHVLSENDFDTAVGRMREERIKLECALSELLCSTEEEIVINRKVQHAHIRIVQLSNKVYKVLKAEGQDSPKKSIAQAAMDCINELMKSAEPLADRYIDHAIALSHYLVDIWGARLFDEYMLVKGKLSDHQVDHLLMDALNSFFQGIKVPQGEMYEPTFRYAEKMIRGLKRLVNEGKLADWNRGIWRLMLYLNFNKKQVNEYTAAMVKEISHSNEPYLIVQEKLLTFLKEVRQMEEHLTLKYLKERISLKAHTIELLEEELNWLQQHRTNLLAEIANSDDNYFIVDLTVRKLNLWAKINVEMGAIPYHSTSHVVKVMANYIRTLKPGPISTESARRKVDYFDPSTIKGLHIWLSRQIEHLEKKYPNELQF